MVFTVCGAVLPGAGLDAVIPHCNSNPHLINQPLIPGCKCGQLLERLQSQLWLVYAQCKRKNVIHGDVLRQNSYIEGIEQ